jgi:proteasome lid subunit RPN8/RPN11
MTIARRFRRSDIRRLISEAVNSAKDCRAICGLLIDNGYFLQIRRTRNVTRRRCSFLLDGRQIRSLERAARSLDLEIVGTFHSHIFSPPEPGESDIRGAVNDSLMLVIDSMEREVTLWRIRNKRAYPLTFRLI